MYSLYRHNTYQRYIIEIKRIQEERINNQKILDTIEVIEYNNGMKYIKIRDIPNDLHMAFKLKCVRNNISMNKCLLDLMKKYVEENNGK